MAGIFSQGGSAGHRYAGWLETVEAKNFQFGGKVFNGSPSAIYVGSNLVWTGGWLTAATINAILGAFGPTDGKAVIKATNAYLNQLAASDRDKATALAGFINEDPMMVCSLGLEVEGVTMPIRSLKGDGTAYINTLISQDADNAYRLGYTNVQNGVNYGPYFGGIGSQSAAYQMYRYIDGNMDYYLTSKLYRSAYDYGVRHLFEADNDKAYLDGVLLTSMSDSGNNNRGYPIGLFKAYTTQVSKGMVDKFDIHRNGVELLNQRPFRLGKAWSADKVSTGVAQAKDTLGMIDLVTGIFYPNAASSGAFTMEGEPSPSTP